MQRVESGRLGGRRLLRLPAKVAGLRPTGARVRGAIFDRLGEAVQGARVLDLFAGSGALSIEALSRGAAYACLVEQNPRVVRFLRAQLDALKLLPEVRLVTAEAQAFLDRQPPMSRYDLVLVDPPFATPAVFAPLAHSLVARWLAPGAIVVCERERVRGTSPAVAWPAALRLDATRVYGQAVVEFLSFDQSAA